MRLRFRGSAAFRVFFVPELTPQAWLCVQLEPSESHQHHTQQEERRNVLTTHQRAFLAISMYSPANHVAIANPPFVNAHGNVKVPTTRRSSSANTNQSSATSRHASATRSLTWPTCSIVNFIRTEATSAFPRRVKSSTPRGVV